MNNVKYIGLLMPDAADRRQPLSSRQRRMVLRFFRFYAKCEGLLNLLCHHPRQRVRGLTDQEIDRAARAMAHGVGRRSHSDGPRYSVSCRVLD
jgi:hypothetical protein